MSVEELPNVYASAFANKIIHIISVNDKVHCNLLNATDARSYVYILATVPAAL